MNMKNYSVILLSIFLGIKVNAQNAHIVVSDSKANTALLEYSAGKIVPCYITFKDNYNLAPQMAFIELSDELSIRNEDTWKILRSEQDDIGYTHHRYQQYYKGIKVEQGEFIIHEKNNRTVSANGDFIDNIDLSIIPGVTRTAALNFALADINATTYKWQFAGEENWYKQIMNNPKATLYPKAELVIIRLNNNIATKEKQRLAWKFDIYTHDPNGRWFVYVDANTGDILDKVDRICEFVAPGIANTKYSGVQPIVSDSLGPNNFRLRDYSRGAPIATYDMNKGTSYGSAVDFTDDNNVWDSITNQDNAAYDAHHGAEKTWDYFNSVHGRNSYDNFGSPLISYIHYSNNYNNAFWNGSVMTYGDGNGSTFSPLTTIDICGHELTHGVTGNTSNLVYSYESGALNESFSDIFGTCIDFFAFPGSANWKLGEQCYTPGTSGDALRHLDNPNAASDPDTYLGTFWWTSSGDNGGVHTNSGVQNFWFYLLSQGGTGTNDVGFNYNVSAIGMANARLIAYRNNAYYLTSGSVYADARRYSIIAAADIFGPCSNEMIQTNNAWNAVGVTGTFSGNPLATATNSGITCEGTTVNLTSAGGVSFLWSGPGAYSSTLQNPQLSEITSAQSGTYTVTVTDANACSGSVTTQVSLHTRPTLSGVGISLCPAATGMLDPIAAAYGGGGPAFTTANPAIIAIPDNNSTGIQSPITIATPANASEVISVEIDSLDHSWNADLNIKLKAPNGSEITLANGVGGSGDNFDNTIFSATATNVIGSSGNNTSPFNGTYAPQQSFSNLTGAATGTWNLKVIDAYDLDAGSLRGWKITIASANQVTTYAWSPSLGLSSTTQATPSVSLLDSATYTVVVTDNKGCTNSKSMAVNLFPLATATVTSSNILCGGSATGSLTVNPVTGTSPFSYSLDNVSFVPGNTFATLPAGSYTAYIKDVNNCNTDNYGVTITENNPLTATATGVNNNCYGGKSGTVNLTPGGGTLPFAFLWSNAKTTEDLASLVAGTYTCTVTDINGCTTTMSRTVTQGAQITMTFTKTDATAPLFNNGIATCFPANGFPTYRYTWNTTPSKTTQTITGLTAGVYVVTVKDNKKCSRNGSVTIAALRIGGDEAIGNIISAAPNPSHGIFAISLNSKNNEMIDANVYDVTGRLVQTNAVYLQKGINEFDIDLTSQMSGLYFLEMKNENRREIIKLTVK